MLYFCGILQAGLFVHQSGYTVDWCEAICTLINVYTSLFLAGTHACVCEGKSSGLCHVRYVLTRAMFLSGRVKAVAAAVCPPCW